MVHFQIESSFKDFLKAVKKHAQENFAKLNIEQKRGSGIRFELFKNEEDEVPVGIWVVHEDKYIWSDDLDKACKNLGVDKKEFEESTKKSKKK